MSSLGEVLGHGGEGTVYAVKGNHEIACKIWNPDVTKDAEAAHKIKLMLKNPVMSGSVAWPKKLVHYSNGTPAGFTMPRYSALYRDLFTWMNPAARRQNNVQCGINELLCMTANLASAIGAIHRAGHIVGDINEKNAVANAEGRVILVDCDSMQIKDPETGRDFLCKRGRPEYTPPELQDTRYDHRLRTEDYDRFGLAVLAHKLLLNGLHPYQSVSVSGNTQAEKIQQHLFPFNETVRQEGIYKPAKHHLEAWRNTPYAIRELFHRAFDPDWTARYPRPTPQEWASVIARELGLPSDTFQDGPTTSLAASAHLPTPNEPAPPCPECKGETQAKPTKNNSAGYFWSCRKFPDCRGSVDAAHPDTPDCPTCGSAMAIRQARKGANAGSTFWGCRRYPECRGTREMN